MASGSDIKAGGVFIEIFEKGSEKVALRLKALAGMVTAIGAGLSAIGGSALGGFAASLKAFSDAGSAINDSLGRTGLGSDLLQTLAFSAEQAGGSITDVEAAAKKMAKTIGAAQGGSKMAVKALADIGLTAKQLLAMHPDDRFLAVANGIAAIQDPTLRSAAAMKVMGGSAAKLMEILNGGAAGINAAQQELAASGLLLSAEDIANADALGDAWGKLTATLARAWQLIGAALAPAVTDLIGSVQEWVTWLAKTVDANREMIRWLAVGAVVVAGLGAVITTLGAAIFALAVVIAAIPAIIAGITAAFSGLMAIIGAILSPIGLWVAAIVAIAAAIPVAIYMIDQLAFSGAGLKFLGDAFFELWDIVGTTVKGIFDAISTGNWQLAGEIAMAGLHVAFTTGWGWIKIGLIDLLTYVADKFIEFFGQNLIGIVSGGIAKIIDMINAGAKLIGGGDLLDSSGFKATADSAKKGTLQTDLATTSEAAKKAIRDEIAGVKGGLGVLAGIAADEKKRRFAPAAQGGRGLPDIPDTMEEFKQTMSLGATNSAAAIRLGGQTPVFDKLLEAQLDANDILADIAENTEDGGIGE